MLKYTRIHRMIFHCSSIYIKELKKEGLNKQDIKDMIKNQQQLKEMEHRVQLYGDFIQISNYKNSNKNKRLKD